MITKISSPLRISYPKQNLTPIVTSIILRVFLRLVEIRVSWRGHMESLKKKKKKINEHSVRKKKKKKKVKNSIENNESCN
jgi:hypothetical protein